MSETPNFKLFALGTNAITIEFGNKIDPELNQNAIELASFIESLKLDWVTETLPSYASLTVFFGPSRVPEDPFRLLTEITREHFLNPKRELATPREHIIPVSFEEDDAQDLKFVASSSGLTREKVIETFLSEEYRVYMLGFLPGFPYMGKLDDSIATPRKERPRRRVPAGSVGIAGNQTGIYPFDSPGGWQLIGRTEATIFDPQNENPATFKPGDLVRFERCQ